MPGLRDRLSEAWITLLGRQRYFSATVTKREIANQGRREQHTYAELLLRFQNHVYVAITRNAQAVANKPLRVYRKTPSAFPEFEGRPVTKRRHKYLCQGAGPVVRKKIDEQDDVEEITDELHPLVQLLDRVNQQDNGFDLIEDTVMGMEFAGNFYWKPIMGDRWPVEIWTLAPQHVRIVPSENDNALIAYYAYGRERDNEERYLPSEVIHFKYRNPHSPFYGFPPLAACITEADVCTGFGVFALATLKNGVSPGLVLGSTKGLDPEQVRQIEYQMEGKYAGEIHAAKTIVVGGPLDTVHSLQHTSAEASFLESDKHYRERIANCFGMPVGILTLENASLAASQESVHQWQLQSIAPKCRKIEDVLNQRLVPMFGDDSLFVAFDNPIDEDEEESANRAVALFGGDIVSRGEARAMVGMDALGDERDDQFSSDSKLAQAEAFAASQPASPFGGFGPFGPGGFGGGMGLDDGGLEFEKPLALPAPGGMQLRHVGGNHVWDNEASLAEAAGTNAADRAHQSGTHGGIRSWDASVLHIGSGSAFVQSGIKGTAATGRDGGRRTDAVGQSPIIRQHSLWFTDEWGDCCVKPPRGHTVTKDDRAAQIVRVTEAELTRALQRFFGGLQGPIARAVEQGAAIRLSSDRSLVEALAAELSDPLGKQFVEAYNSTLAGLGSRVSLDPIDFTNARALAYMRENPPVLASAVLQGMEERIGSELARGIEAGEGNVDLAKRIEHIVGTPAAAERIARTESSHAFMEAREGAWKDSGIVESKEWLLSSDPCPICEAIAAKRGTVPVGQPFYAVGDSFATTDGKSFNVSFRSINGPPAHPFCRCSLGAVFK